ncbi:MAG: 50S ribosomal protein L18e [Candidatus Aenigmarchaeota archaeon]|nr:50S ribosomal protein L18e [Candidatus Aenigmarchaeota archaeon]
MPHPTGPTDPNMEKLISDLKRKKEKFYLVVAKHLEKSRRRKSAVNIGKIERHANYGENVVVPGKVVGGGEIIKKVNVYAWKYSKTAREKIKQAGGRCLELEKIFDAKEKGRILI